MYVEEDGGFPLKKSILEIVDVAITVTVMGAVVVVARRRKGSGALGGSALLDGAQMSSGRIQIGLGGGGLSIGLGGASQGGLASHLCRAGLLLCGQEEDAAEEGMAQGQAGAQGATPAGSATAREMRRREGGEVRGTQRQGRRRAQRVQRRQRKGREKPRLLIP
jgi:hypothetical protein